MALTLRLAPLLLGTVILLSACERDTTPDMTAVQAADADAHGFSAPTPATRAAHAAIAQSLPLADERDFAAATQGFIAHADNLHITRHDGSTIWRPENYAFVKDAAPDSVNPSLWRQEKLNNLHGLFKVSERVFQIRGYDLANMTIIEGDSGRILIDPLTAAETANAALDLVEKHLGQRAISAIIFTHSHIDHFGGSAAILQRTHTQTTPPRLIAPEGFLEEAVSENVLAGSVMMRRAQYMYGSELPIGERGHVGTGLGKQPAFGSPGLVPPTDIIEHTGQTLTLDGIEFEFQMVPESEAPAEMTFYLPQFRIFCGAELVSRTLHNLYTLRGAKVRDGLKWSNYIQEALDRYGARSDVIINSHHWPIWGNDNAQTYLRQQRDLYKYIHDQTLRLANQGYTPDEIADTLQLPESLAQTFHTRDYYGTVRHNTRAVYQFYFGWYDANPAHLNPHPKSVTAARYVEAMGGMDAVLQRAQQSFNSGDYRWAAELLNHAVFADPQHATAREQLARSYDQLGYQAESGPWRDAYLSGALELRRGVQPPKQSADKTGILRQIPMSHFFTAIATLLNGPKADGKHIVANFHFTDIDEQHVVWLENAVLHHRRDSPQANADFTVKLTRAFWLKLLNKEIGAKDLLTSDELDIEGDKLKLVDFLSLLEKPDEQFAIVTP